MRFLRAGLTLPAATAIGVNFAHAAELENFRALNAAAGLSRLGDEHRLARNH